MPAATVERLIDEMGEFRLPFTFSPFKVNEPLLDKRLFDFCRRFAGVTQVGEIRIFTNGSPLTDKMVDKIAELERVQHLWVSLNSIDPEHYSTLMNLDFERTAANLDRLHARDDFPLPVILSAVGLDNKMFPVYVRNRWPRFRPALIPNTGWLGYTEFEDYSAVPREPCSRWWELSIMANGKVALCCMDGTGEFAIGDINKNTLLEVYNSPGWRERRVELQDRHEIRPCRRCTY